MLGALSNGLQVVIYLLIYAAINQPVWFVILTFVIVVVITEKFFKR